MGKYTFINKYTGKSKISDRKPAGIGWYKVGKPKLVKELDGRQHFRIPIGPYSVEIIETKPGEIPNERSNS